MTRRNGLRERSVRRETIKKLSRVSRWSRLAANKRRMEEDSWKNEEESRTNDEDFVEERRRVLDERREFKGERRRSWRRTMEKLETNEGEVGDEWRCHRPEETKRINKLPSIFVEPCGFDPGGVIGRYRTIVRGRVSRC